jgi:hypothetical protein
LSLPVASNIQHGKLKALPLQLVPRSHSFANHYDSLPL